LKFKNFMHLAIGFFLTTIIIPIEMMMSEILQVKKLSATAIIPSRGSLFAAGYDLSSAHDSVVPARGKALIKTDLAIAIPLNTYARVGMSLLFFSFIFFNI